MTIYINNRTFAVEWDAMLIMVGISLVSILFHLRQNSLLKGNKQAVIILLTLYVFFAFASSLIGTTEYFNTGVKNCIAIYIIMFALLSMDFSDSGDIIEKLFAIVCLILGVIIIYNYLVGNSIQGDGRNYSVRIMGVYKDPNYLNAIMLPGVGIFWYRSRTAENSIKKYLSLICALLLMTASICTGERAGLLAVLICFVYQISVMFVKEKKYFNVFLAIAVGFLGYYLFVNVLDAEMSKRMSSITDGSSQMRVLAWEVALTGAFLKNPLLGGGYEAGAVQSLSRLGMHTHSCFIDLLCEQGIIGAILFISIIIALRKRSINLEKFDSIIILGFVPLMFVNGLNSAQFWLPLMLTIMTNMKYNTPNLDHSYTVS